MSSYLPPEPTPYAAGQDRVEAQGSRGPAIAIASGVIVLVIGLAIGVTSGILAARTLPLGVLTLSGEPGSEVLLTVDSPGAGEVALEADKEYAFLLVESTSRAGSYLDGMLEVTGPDGSALTVADRASSELSVSSGGFQARVAGAVRPTATGPHDVVVPPTAARPARVMVIEMPELTAMFAGIFGGVLGIIAAVFLVIAGGGLLAWGLTWRAVRRRSDEPEAVSVAPPLY